MMEYNHVLVAVLLLDRMEFVLGPAQSGFFRQPSKHVHEKQLSKLLLITNYPVIKQAKKKKPLICCPLVTEPSSDGVKIRRFVT